MGSQNQYTPFLASDAPVLHSLETVAAPTSNCERSPKSSKSRSTIIELSTFGAKVASAELQSSAVSEPGNGPVWIAIFVS